MPGVRGVPSPSRRAASGGAGVFSAHHDLSTCPGTASWLLGGPRVCPLAAPRRWLAGFVFISALALLAPAAPAELVRVKQVYDGDTILLQDGRKVRYLGVNAPEFQEPFYLKAKRLNESLVLEQEVRLEFDEERTDAFDRLLAYVHVGEEMVNAKLVQEGLAHAFFIGPSRRYNTLLLRLQEEAKQKRIGIWSGRARPRDLKITSVHLSVTAEHDPYGPYVRIANLAGRELRLKGYVLSNESGHSYVFPDVAVEPGRTVIVASNAGADGIDDKGQLVVHWPAQAPVLDPKEDTAFLIDPAGALVDMFHYKGKRVTRPRRIPSVP